MTVSLLEQLIEAFRILPGVGQKTAQRMAYHVLERDRDGAQRLSEADVKYMTDNLLPVLRHIGALQSGDAEELLVTLGPLLSAQTFTILQLLGFNFQKAIGEPLTNLVGAWIGSVERRTTSPGGRPSPQPSGQPQRRK